MSWLGRLGAPLDILVRIPPLFIMDSILNRSFLWFIIPCDHLSSWKEYLIWLGAMTVFFVGGFCLFFFSQRKLVQIYSYLLTIGILLVSYWYNLHYVYEIHSRQNTDHYLTLTSQIPEPLEMKNGDFIKNGLIQLFLSSLFHLVWIFQRCDTEDNRVSKGLGQIGIHLSFLFPIILKISSQSDKFILWSPMAALLFPMFLTTMDILSSLSEFLFMARRLYSIINLMISTVGLHAFLEDQWKRLHVPQVLRCFYVCRLAYILVQHFIKWPKHPLEKLEIEETDLNYETWMEIIQNLLVRNCETVIALLGTTSVISLIAHYVGLFMAFCVGSNSEEDRNMGTVSAILFFILALQTGLTGLAPDKRLVRLYRNLSLLSTAILHFIHGMVNPVLLSLSASRNMSIIKHVRALAMCLFLITFPICLLTYLWREHSASTWLLAVTAFSVEIIIKVLVTLSVYTLFMIDAYRDEFWEKLDDYVYYVQSTGNTIEFLFGVFLFCNGGWIMLFESGGAIRAVMMCIHAYFNIWVQAKDGWKVFIKRRTAVNKIKSLAEATTEQLREYNDVCAICYQELKSARVTQCNHFFHSICLRKWLYVQDSCPLCHQVLYQLNTMAGPKQK
ncbi:hypothetical protein ACJMK2_004919 [Sinanodonta woodiana]|uniref:RING-type domain-containing protein n=1 Tax=Sinanodonta woodiana TaxID=1069815 RepID=A0ABD3VNH2_SINWO